ncbi:hypothetical protein ACQR53_18380 [Xanthomonas oryzae]|uniref:hypothetical protein n=1 Tax=Xanthomonas oryzae TaxID=347 RepID=UPI001033DF0D|nr:hypothetical protein [Xanthomonas oryzae]QBG86827.1 hypothetical protein EYC54_02425 [Xanthomonas oryzae]
MNSADQITLDESMRLCLLYFKKAIRSSVTPPEKIYEEFGGHSGVAWELRQELLSGEALLDWDGLTGEQKIALTRCILLLRDMPLSAFAGEGLQDLFDPSWDIFKKAAKFFIIKNDLEGTA